MVRIFFYTKYFTNPHVAQPHSLWIVSIKAEKVFEFIRINFACPFNDCLINNPQLCFSTNGLTKMAMAQYISDATIQFDTACNLYNGFDVLGSIKDIGIP